MAEEKIIGIDLGTTNSVVAVMEGSEVKVIANQEGLRLTPSVVAFTDKGDRLVGDPAKRQAVTNSRRTIYSIKRFMGRRHNEVLSEEKLVPYKVVGAPEELVQVDIDAKRYTPQEISAMVLRKLKEAAEAYLGHPVRKAVITVPAYFNDSQRNATIDAARIAGFDTEWELEDPKSGKKSKQRLRIINEPTAASLAYGLDKKKNEKIAVFDLGGGTFDISILDVSEGLFEVKSTNGDTHLGGDDFDQTLIEHVAGEFQKQHGIDLRKDPMALQRLKEACEQAKKDLSHQPQVDINLPFITADASGAKHLQMTITRSQLERLVEHLIDRCRQPVLIALKDAGYKPADIDEIVLVGGMTRMPRVQQLVKEIFGKEGHRGVNPDEVVAVGAAIQGSLLSTPGDRKVLLLDVTPLSLGIGVASGEMVKIVEKNTTIPWKKTRDDFMRHEDQTTAMIPVYQGERPMAADNRLLGEFRLENLPETRAGQPPRIEVTFDIDANGILTVTARDKVSGKAADIRIERSSDLSKDDVERMRQEAEVNAEADKKKVELANEKYRAEDLAHRVEKQMAAAGAQLSDADAAPIKAAIDKVRQAVTGDDLAAIKQAASDLAAAAQALAKSAAPPAETTPPPAESQ
ncbi:MAG: molecular chaperone DnaK [Planctomycetes bacterium]|nr:molecular chaperone DnaK [Planctomycetota bacterium]